MHIVIIYRSGEPSRQGEDRSVQPSEHATPTEGVEKSVQPSSQGEKRSGKPPSHIARQTTSSQSSESIKTPPHNPIPWEKLKKWNEPPTEQPPLEATNSVRPVTFQPPISPGKRFGTTRGGFKFAVPAASGINRSKLGIRRGGNSFAKGRGGHTVAFGRTMSAPAMKPTENIGTQESVSNQGSKKPPTKKQVEPVKRRTPSQRIVNKKLGKKVAGPGRTYDDAITLN